MANKSKEAERQNKALQDIISGREHEKDYIQVGYEGKTPENKGGETRKSKHSDIMASVRMPWFCPKCKKVMKNRNDKPFYNIHKKCFNCVVEFEHELRKKGEWDEYQRKVKNNEIDNHIKEYKLFVEEKLRESNEAHVSEAGDVEKWIGKIDKDKVDIATQEVIDYLEKLKT